MFKQNAQNIHNTPILHPHDGSEATLLVPVSPKCSSDQPEWHAEMVIIWSLQNAQNEIDYALVRSVMHAQKFQTDLWKDKIEE